MLANNGVIRSLTQHIPIVIKLERYTMHCGKNKPLVEQRKRPLVALDPLLTRTTPATKYAMQH